MGFDGFLVVDKHGGFWWAEFGCILIRRKPAGLLHFSTFTSSRFSSSFCFVNNSPSPWLPPLSCHSSSLPLIFPGLLFSSFIGGTVPWGLVLLPLHPPSSQRARRPPLFSRSCCSYHTSSWSSSWGWACEVIRSVQFLSQGHWSKPIPFFLSRETVSSETIKNIPNQPKSNIK